MQRLRKPSTKNSKFRAISSTEVMSKWRHVARTALALGLATIAVLLVSTASVWHSHPPRIESIRNWPASPRVLDRDGNVLFQTVGSDDQWRIPVELEDISPWLIGATIAVEDQRFLEHAGVDSNAVVRAAYQNATAAEVVSGASTITMQLCRMLHPRPRSLASKFIEAVHAIQLEQRLSKREILSSYLNVAPYGGNLRGVEAAAQRYFNKSASNLSLGEATLIAGLPQSPSRFRPDRFPHLARKRQRYVLDRMLALDLVTQKQKQNALDEPIQLARRSTNLGSHVTTFALTRRRLGGRTTIDSTLQAEVQQAVTRYSKRLPEGTDVAIVIIDIQSSEIRALVGSSDFLNPAHGQVNGVIAQRSPGSALKPFIYAAAFEAQRLAPNSVLIDQPIERAGWSPNNFDRSFQGELTVEQALRESRNVPAILVMEALGVARCVGVLDAVGISLPDSAETRGGLSICVGTAETTLLDLTNGYATLGRNGICSIPRLFVDEPIRRHAALSTRTAKAINRILSSETRQPNGTIESGNMHPFMWKTGTSSGRRDAWAIGHNGRYAIGVWVGRFSGAGHTQFVGRVSAEPLLVDLFFHQDIVAIDGWNSKTMHAPIVVTRPLVFERKEEVPRIQSPANDAIYLATQATTTIPVVHRNAENARWFLNGRLITDSLINRLSLSTGSYELRCQAAGKSHTVAFRVEPAGPRN